MTLRKRRLRGLLAGMLVFSMVTPVCATDLEDAKQKAQQIQEQQQKAETEKLTLSENLQKIVGEMNKADQDMQKKEQEIVVAEEKLVNAKVDEQNQYASMKLRIKYMYENGNRDFIAAIMESKNMTDFLNKAEYATKVSQYDRNMLKRLQKLVDQIAEDEKKLHDEHVELTKMQDDLTAKQKEIEKLLEENKEKLAELDSQMTEAQRLIDAAKEAERKRQEAAEAERKKQEAAEAEKHQQSQSSGGSSSGGSSSGGSSSGGSSSGGSSSGGSSSGGAGGNVVTGNGMFTHPCPGMSYQSSYFGEIRPGIDPRPHKGHDYAAPQGTPIYAAAAGRVVVAGYSRSAGYWVVINHGNGLVTKYMHMYQMPYVSAGQSVSKGQHIGGVGTTGMSTGNHLHFQVEKNGVAVNPSGYM